MSLETFIGDCTTHFFGGFTVSGIDYLVPRPFIASKKDARERRVAELKETLETKNAYLGAVRILLKAQSISLDVTRDEPGKIDKTFRKEKVEEERAAFEQSVPVVDKTSVQYAQNVAAVREHLVEAGVFADDRSLIRKVGEATPGAIKQFFTQPRINAMGWKGKLALSTIVELGYFTWTHYAVNVTADGKVFEKGSGSMGSIAENLYQIPMFYFGLAAGTIFFKGADNLLVKTKEERALEKEIKMMNARLSSIVKQTPVADIVKEAVESADYKAKLGPEGHDYGADFTKRGERVFAGVKKYAQKVTGVGDYFKRKEDAKVAKAAKTESDFDQLLGRK